MLPLHFICAYVQSHLTTVQDRLEDKGDEGATAVEYGLLVSLIAVVIIVGATAFGSRINALFTAVVAKIVLPT